MSLRVDPKLKSPEPTAPAASNLKKPEHRGEVRSNASNTNSKETHAASTKESKKESIHQVEHKDDYKAEKKPANTSNRVQAPKNNPIKDSTKETEVDSDLEFSAELEKQMEGADIALVEGMPEDLQEIPVTQTQAVTALSALAGIAAAQEAAPTGKAPVEVVFNNAQEKVLAPKQNSDLQALLTGDGQMNVEMPQTDSSLYSADKLLKTSEGEVVDLTAKVKSTKEVAQPQITDNENVVDLLNQKRNLKNPVQGQYANQNPKLILEKVMKEVKTKTGNMEVTPDEIKMMKNLDYLNDADKVVKFVGGDKDLSANLNTKATDKVFDLSKIKTTNANEIIDQISNHIIQNQAARSKTVDLAVNHNELGRINIHVQKLNPEQVNIQIMTQTPEGKQFFAENTRGLLNHLSTNGVNVADLKLDNTSSSQLNSGKDHASSSDQFAGNRGQHSQNQSEDNNRRQDSKRREDLWDAYRRNAA